MPCKIGVFRDPFHFRDPTHIFRIGADNIDRLFLDQVLEILPQVDLFSGVNRDRGTHASLREKDRRWDKACSRP